MSEELLKLRATHGENASPEVISFIKENYKKIGPKGCAEKLGCSKAKVKNLVHRLKMFEPCLRYYTEEEINFLKENYYSLGPKKIAEKFGITKNNLNKKANNLGLKINHSIRCQDSWNKEDISEMCNFDNPFVVYFWGFFWADGYVGRVNNNLNFRIAKDDFNCIKDRVKEIAPLWKITEVSFKNPNYKIQTCAMTTNYHLHGFFKNYDYHIKSGASATKILNAIPKNLRHYWWRGLFDGDGCFCFYPQRGVGVTAKITSCLNQNWDFAEDLEKEGIVYSVRLHRKKDNPNSGSSNLSMDGGVSVSKFMDYILKGETFGLSRKRDKYINYKEYMATHIENKKEKKTSIYRGVGLKRGYWVMEIRTKNLKKCEYFGKTENDEINAAKEYDRLAKIAFGNKAQLNFPNE
jgi:biotin operon repressor